MSIFEPVPELQLARANQRVLRLADFADAVRLLYWALWAPQLLDDYVAFFRTVAPPQAPQPPPGPPANDEPARPDMWGFYSQSIIVATVVLLLATLLTVSILGTRISHPRMPLALVVSFGAGFLFGAIGLFFSVVVLRFLDSPVFLPSLAIPFVTLIGCTAPAIVLRVVVNVPWSLETDFWQLIAIPVLIGVSANLSALLYTRRPLNWSRTFLVGAAAALVTFTETWVVSGLANVNVWDDVADVLVWPTVPLAVGLSLGILSVLRPLDWLFAQLMNQPPERRFIPRVTSIPHPGLATDVADWLDFDWDNGLGNALELWNYTAQHEVVRTQILAGVTRTNGDQMVGRILGLATPQTRWNYRDFFTLDQAGLQRRALRGERQRRRTERNDDATVSPVESRRRRRRRRRQLRPVSAELATGEPANRIIAGCWYLAERYPALAEVAFAEAGSARGVEEMRRISAAFERLWDGENLAMGNRLELPAQPPDPQRRVTWDILDQLRSVVSTAWYYRSVDPANRAPYQLQPAQDTLAALALRDPFPQPEGALIRGIIDEWQGEIEALLGAVNLSQARVRRVDNEYVYASPVTRPANIVIARTELIIRVRNLILEANPQPIMVFGPRFIGKTSFALALMAGEGMPTVVPIYLDFRDLPSGATALQRFAKGLAAELDRPNQPWKMNLAAAANVSPEDALARLRQILTDDSNSKFLLIIDHSELAVSRFPPVPGGSEFLRFLWDIQQLSPRMVVMLLSSATQSQVDTLFPERVIRYSTAVTVDRLGAQDTSRILDYRRAVFAPRWLQMVFDFVYAETEGHPMFIQMIANHLMREFNGELGQGRQGISLELADVQRLVANPEFTGIASEYVNDWLRYCDTQVPFGRQVLVQLTAAPAGWPVGALAAALPAIPAADLQTALDLLVGLGIVEVLLIGGIPTYRVPGALIRGLI